MCEDGLGKPLAASAHLEEKLRSHDTVGLSIASDLAGILGEGFPRPSPSPRTISSYRNAIHGLRLHPDYGERDEGHLEKRGRPGDTVRLSAGAASDLKFGDEIEGHPEGVARSHRTARLSTGADLCLKFGDEVLRTSRGCCARS